MRLGTILGGEAWGALKNAARDKRRADAKSRKDAYDRKTRREALNAAGFVPLKSHQKNQAWWGAE